MLLLLNYLNPCNPKVPTCRRICLLVRIMITFVCSWQLESITEAYYRGETTSKVQLLDQAEIELPNVNLCFDFLDTINVTKFKDLFPGSESLFRPRSYIETYEERRAHLTRIFALLSDLTINGLYETMKNVDNIITRIIPTEALDLNDTGDDTPVSVTCNTTKYIRQPQFCITISCYRTDGRGLFYQKSELFEPINGGQMLRIDLDPQVTQISPSVQIIFTAPGQLVQGFGHTAYEIEIPSRPQTYIISYSKIVNILLGSTYETNCRDYSSEGFASKADFVDACLNEISFQRLSAAFYGTLQFPDEPGRNLKSGYHQYYQEFLHHNKTHREQLRVLFRKSRKQCLALAEQEDCLNNVYIPYGATAQRLLAQGCTLKITAPTIPFEINQFYPEYTLAEFLIYLGSTLNFWFGISLLGVSERSIEKLLGFCHRRQQMKLKVSTISCPAQSVREIRPKIGKPRVKAINFPNQRISYIGGYSATLYR